jgi:hypothetical protein
MRHSSIAAALAFVVLPVVAQAQSTPSQPRFEVGTGIAADAWFSDGWSEGLVDLRLTGRLTRRFAVEFVTDLLARDLAPDHLYGLYVIQGTFLVHESAPRDLSVLATFGGLGGFERTRVRAMHDVAPDGRVWDYPARTYSEFSHPTEIVGGMAVQKVLGKHVAVRGDAQIVVCAYGEGAGFRGAIGLSVPLGHYPTATAR